MDRSAARRTFAPAATYDTGNQVDTVPTADRYVDQEGKGGGMGILVPPPDISIVTAKEPLGEAA